MLNKSKLEKNLLQYLKEFRNTPEEAAKDLANIIDDYIKSAIVKSQGTIVIPPGTIQVIGTGGSSVNVQPIILNNIQNKGKLH